MKKLYKNSLYLLMAGALVASCADYNETDKFTAEPDPTYTAPYADFAPVKSYIDKAVNPNLTIGATLDIKEFNKQELAHSAAMTNFDNVSFGKTLMLDEIVGETGVMNFMQMMDLLEHMDEVGGEVYGSPIAANANEGKAVKWIKMLTAPIEIPVDYVEGKTEDFSTYPAGSYEGTVGTGPVSIVKLEDQNVLYLEGTSKKGASANIVEHFDLEPGATYTSTIWARAAKDDASFNVTFSGNKIDGTATSDGKWMVKSDKWYKVVIEGKAAEDVTDGYLEIAMVRGSKMYIQKAEIGYYPDNHRPQTEQEVTDTIHYALNTWCDGLMKINKGRIKSFDLIDEPIDEKSLLNDEIYDVKHSTSSSVIYWQDILSSEKYAPEVAKVVRETYEKYEGNPSDLKLFISEKGLENTKKMESLKYWINIWDNNGAKIDGINAKVNLVYYEDPVKQAENKAAYETLLDKLVETGKLVRISNFDIKYVNADNLNVSVANITDEQREKLADYNAYALKTYMSKVPSDKQAGICKGNIVDSSDPVGLWTKASDPKLKSDWLRNATYKAWCDALSGK